MNLVHGGAYWLDGYLRLRAMRFVVAEGRDAGFSVGPADPWWLVGR